MAVHQAQQAEAPESMQVELRGTRAATSSRLFEHVAAQPLVATLRGPTGRKKRHGRGWLCKRILDFNRFFSSSAAQQALDRATVDLDAPLLRQLLRKLAPTQLGVATMKIEDPCCRLIRQLERAGTPGLAVGQPGHTSRFECGERRVVRLPRKAEFLGHRRHAAPIDGMGTQHLVLDLDLVQRIEESMALERLCTDPLGMTVQGA